MLAGLVLALSGCSASASIVSIDGHETVLITYPSSGGDSTIEGELVEIGNCIGVDSGAGPMLVLFPPGTHITPDKDVLMESDDLFALGSEIVIVGRTAKTTTIDGHDRLPADCLTQDAFLAQEVSEP